MERQLRHTLDVLQGQSLKPDEVVVVDDGSGDGTVEWLHGYMHTTAVPIILIRQEHAGASAARNRGFAEAKSEYVMFLDADVVLKKHALERLFETLTQNSKLKTQNLGVGFAYSSFRWGWKKFSSFPFDAERLRQTPFIHTTSLIRKDILPEKPFDENLKRLQDWDLYLTLLERGQGGVYVPEVLFTVEPKGTMSKWLPSIMYQIPFEKLGMKIMSLEKYREAELIVRKKHNL